MDIDQKISIYVIKNLVNGMRYVGITKNLEGRWRDHCRKKSVSLLQRAINKYGIDAFEFNHIADAFTWDDACSLERMLIKEFNSRSPNGYNATDGGDGGFGYKFDEEEKRARSNRMKTDANPMLGKLGEKNHFFGKNHSESARAKMAAAWVIRKAKEGYKDPRVGKTRKKAEHGY